MTLQTGQALSKDSQTLRDAEGRQFIIEAGGVAATLGVSASVVAPGVGGAIASLVTPPPGIYRVSGVVVLTGTAETGLVNVRLQVNSVPVVLIPSLTGIAVPFSLDRVAVTAGSIALVSVAAAVGGSIYTASLLATRVE